MQTQRALEVCRLNGTWCGGLSRIIGDRPLGGNQVGKAAIDGWKSVIQPALRRGAHLLPFDGRLDELSQLSGCVLCETYPQEAYAHVGVKLRQGGGKRIQKDRQDAGASMMCWAEKYGVQLADDARTKLREGFGSSESGEDPFDACVGLFSMIEVVDGRRPEGEAPDGDATTWEGSDSRTANHRAG